MPRCACANEIYCSVCVSVCLCRLLKDQSSSSKSFYRLLVTFSWILIRGFKKKMLRSRVMPRPSQLNKMFHGLSLAIYGPAKKLKGELGVFRAAENLLC